MVRLWEKGDDDHTGLEAVADMTESEIEARYMPLLADCAMDDVKEIKFPVKRGRLPTAYEEIDYYLQEDRFPYLRDYRGNFMEPQVLWPMLFFRSTPWLRECEWWQAHYDKLPVGWTGKACSTQPYFLQSLLFESL